MQPWLRNLVDAVPLEHIQYTTDTAEDMYYRYSRKNTRKELEETKEGLTRWVGQLVEFAENRKSNYMGKFYDGRFDAMVPSFYYVRTYGMPVEYQIKLAEDILSTLDAKIAELEAE